MAKDDPNFQKFLSSRSTFSLHWEGSKEIFQGICPHSGWVLGWWAGRPQGRGSCVGGLSKKWVSGFGPGKVFLGDHQVNLCSEPHHFMKPGILPTCTLCLTIAERMLYPITTAFFFKVWPLGGRGPSGFRRSRFHFCHWAFIVTQ